MPSIPKPKKSPSITNLRRKADKLWSKSCFKKWGNRCICGREATQTHHFFAKSTSAPLRYETENGIPLCYYCHIIRIHSQGDPLIFDLIKEKRGQKWYDNLKRLKRESEGMRSFQGVRWYKEQIIKFEEYLKR